jgi:hypothetical protein
VLALPLLHLHRHGPPPPFAPPAAAAAPEADVPAVGVPDSHQSLTRRTVAFYKECRGRTGFGVLPPRARRLSTTCEASLSCCSNSVSVWTEERCAAALTAWFFMCTSALALMSRVIIPSFPVLCARCSAVSPDCGPSIVSANGHPRHQCDGHLPSQTPGQSSMPAREQRAVWRPRLRGCLRQPP